ncbi:receptor-type tyrosine-protein phosphatase S-like isoform X1 [Rhopilema esculentum]|uniref:receptor-type tyrosine-protein phosphatase S-like isoform X1 n=2 Tax=Rhopilema esculentum TaxID=499914 RepID=UPI0031D48EFD
MEFSYKIRATDVSYFKRLLILLHFSQLVKTEFTVNGLLGNSVTLVCNVNGVSLDLGTEVITWKHNSGSLFIDGSRVRQPEKFKLEINPLKYSDGGLYSCYMQTILLNSTRLNIEGKPFFTEVFDPKTIFSGKEFNLRCAIKSHPVAKVIWKRNGVQITNGSGIASFTYQVPGDVVRSELRSASASYLHNGTYSCTASNSHGSINHEAPIQIYVPAFIKSPPDSMNVVRAGSNVTLRCIAFGNPQPSLFWLNGTGGQPDPQRYLEETHVTGFKKDSSLRIVRAKRTDSGNFTCVVMNSFSSVNRANVALKVQDIPICCRIISEEFLNRRIKLSWNALSDGNSQIFRYSIVVKNRYYQRNFVLPAWQKELDVAPISPSMPYEIAMTAENAIGVSREFIVRGETLKEDYSTCISSFINVATSASVTIGWSPSCDPSSYTGNMYVDVIVLKKADLVRVTTFENKPGNRSTTVTGLAPNTEYGIRIREIEPGKRKGTQTEVLKIVTKESAPSLPRNVKATPLDATSIRVFWDPPALLNGVVREYEVEFGYNEQGSVVYVKNMKKINAEFNPERSYTLKQLIANTLYNISVRERTGVGLWSQKAAVSVKTREGVPIESPQNFSMTLTNDSLVTLSWKGIPRESANGDLIGYVVAIKDLLGKTIFNKTVASNATTIRIETLKAHHQYEATIYGYTNVGAGKLQSLIFFTADGVPSAPRELQVMGMDSSSLKLTWKRPQNSNGMITAYQINWEMTHSSLSRLTRSVNSQGTSIIQGVPADLNEIRQHFIRNLKPFSIYGVRVRERTVNGWGPFTRKVEAATFEGESSEPLGLKVVSSTSNSVSFSWTTPRNPNGAIKVFSVKCYQEQSMLKDQKNVTFSKKIAIYRATCHNLKSNTETMIMVYAVSSIKGKAKIITATSAVAPDTGFPWLMLIGGCVGFVIVVALIMTTVLLCKRKTKYVEVRETLEDVEMNGVLNSRPIHIANLKQYVLHNHTNSDHGFFTEYEAIKPAAGNLTWEHSQNQLNQPKNRYSNIVAYDQSRVVLSEINNDISTTYINANYIDGYKKPRKFIATQGPLPGTVNDFWRMVYEQGCQVIVMLTRIIEDHKVKCEQYWPDPGTQQYGEIVIKLIEVTELSDYVVRTFTVKAAYDVEAVGREVKQYHYLGWPDHGVPEYPTSMVTFTKYVMDNAPPKPGPIVVHCSAGVGRTGTLIVIDAMLNQIRDENIVDVYKFVSSIRRQRNFMVQTESQYVFIYDALLDAVICGNTEATAHDISMKLRYLNQQSPDASETYLMQEFKRLEAGLSSQEKELFSISNLPENKEKNRFLNILPYNRNRVKLASIYGQKGSDYINASYIDGYRHRHAFIATQGPLENTVADFWRMIWEQNCNNIVMLTKLFEKSKERSCQYWPNCGSATYGKFLVDELRERDDECDNVVRRELNLTYTETGRSRRLTHYLYTGWPEYGSPNSGTDIIKLISLVQSLKAIRGTGPVVVHCSGGAGRTGAFIAICICIQKLKTEGTVDIFQTVRQLRTQRPAMVQTIDQYYFCYQALKDYVDTTTEVSKCYDLDESLA